MPDPLLAYLPQAIRNAKEKIQALDHYRKVFYKKSRQYLDRRTDLANGIDDAALYPVAMGPWGASAELDGRGREVREPAREGVFPRIRRDERRQGRARGGKEREGRTVPANRSRSSTSGSVPWGYVGAVPEKP